MENMDIQKTEDYLRGKLSVEERKQYESAMAADPELRRQTDDLRQFAEDIRQIARSDIRKRVESVRDSIQREEAEHDFSLKKSPEIWTHPIAMITIGTLLGLALGWLLFDKEPPPTTTPSGIPVADTRFDEIARINIPGPQAGKTISLTVSYKPDLELPNQPARTYAFFGEGGGLCIYARKNDDFWKKPLELVQTGSQYFLQIGDDKFPIISDGEEHPLPDKPPGH